MASSAKYPSFNTSFGRLMPSGQDLQQLAADVASGGGGGIPDAPNNGSYYVRQSLSWVVMPPSPVTSVAGKTGIVTLNHNDITDWASATAGFLTGNQTITLGGDLSGSGVTSITATLNSVNANVGTFQGITVNAKGLVTAAVNQNYAPLNSPVFTGTPTAPTPAALDNTNKVATTAWVTANALIGPITYAMLPAEVQKVPVSFAFPGLPASGVMVNAPCAMALTVPAGLSGTVVYDGSLPTANAVFTLNKISGGTTTALGTVTITPTNHTSATLAGAGGSLAVGDVLQLVAPATPDATLADVGITILAARV